MSDRTRLTEEDWRSLLPEISDIHPLRVEIAYDVLVKGMNISSVARHYDVNIQYVGHCVSMIRNKGVLSMVFVSGWLPERMAKKVMKEIQKYDQSRYPME